ncbi:MAG: DMT family transporter [Actinobacteria bacterium]|nr:DMT family transporter [Actinomycetota bacterium]
MAGAEGKHVAAVWVGVVCFSFGPVLAAAATVPGPVLAFWRLWFAVPVMAAVAIEHVHRTGRRPGWNGWRWTVVAGLAFGIHQLLFMSALQQTSVVDVTLMNTLAPVAVAVLAVPLFGERPGLSFRAWSGIAIAGAAVVALAGSTGPQGNPIGMLLAAGNVIFYSLFFVWSKQARPHIDVGPFLAGTVLVSAVVLSAFVAATGAPVREMTAQNYAVALTIALLPGFVGHFLVTWSLKWVPANIPPVIMLTIPAMSGVLAWLFLSQGITTLELLGGAVTLLGVFFAVRKPSAPPMSVEALDLAEEA